MRFTKGKSGNPGGRPKETAEIVALARQHTTEAITKLAEWMRGENPKASVAACQALLDRGYGKPVQAIEHSGEITHVAELSDEQLLARLERARASGGAVEKAPGKTNRRGVRTVN